jgi:hypothetical protein
MCQVDGDTERQPGPDRLVTELPLTFDASVWWAPRGYVALTAVVALGVYGFRTSLAGKSAFGGDWLKT